MTDKSKQRAKEYAREHGLSHQVAVNRIRRPLKAVVNYSEREVEGRLESSVLSHGARVYSKMRFADVAPIENSGIDNDAYRYALQCHLDFLVVDDQRRPLFAIEFDGGGHDDRQDALKNQLCERFGLPIARLTHRHLAIAARGIDSIEWLTEVFFMSRALDQAQREGQIAPDEPLDPLSMFRWEKNDEPFPLSFSMGCTREVRRAKAAGRVAADFPFYVAFERAGRAAAAVTVRVASNAFLFAGESIYLRDFGVSSSEAAVELAHARMLGLLRGEDVASSAMTAQSAFDRLRAIAEGRSFCTGCCSADAQDFSFSHSACGTRVIPPLALR